MASTYTEGLVIELIGSGDKAGSWGDVTNNNLKSLNQGITGFSEVDLSGAIDPYLIDLSDAQVPDESTSPSRSSIIKFINVPDSPTPFRINFQVNTAPAQRINCVVINGDDNNTISVGTGANGDRLTILNGYAASVYSEVNSGNSSYFDIKNSLANLSVDKIALENNEIIGNATDDKITIGASTLEVGDGVGAVVIKSDNNDLIFKTDDTATNRIRISHGSDDDINVNFDGTGSFNVGGDITTTSAGSITAAGNISTPGNISTTGSGTITSAGLLTVSSGGASVTGNSTIAGTLGSLTGLTLSSGSIDVGGGAITNSGAITASGNVSTSGNILTTGTGAITSANGLTVSGGGAAITGASSVTGSLTVSSLNAGSGTIGGGAITGTSLTVGTGASNTITAGELICNDLSHATSITSTISSSNKFRVDANGAQVVATNGYLNMSSTSGSSGFGFRNNSGTLEIKNSTLGGWGSIAVLSGSDLAVSGSLTAGTSVTAGSTVTAGTGLTVTNGGANITGNSTVTGTLGGITGLTVASGGATISGNSTLTGTLGGLTGLTVASGGASISGGLNNNGGGITNAGTIGAGAITSTSLNAGSGTIETTGSITGSSVTATSALAAPTLTSNTANGNLTVSPNGTGRIILSASAAASGTQAITVQSSNNPILVQATSATAANQLIIFRTGGTATSDNKFIINQYGAYLVTPSSGNRYLSMCNFGGEDESGFRNDSSGNMEVRSKNINLGAAGADAWGRIYHSGMVSGDGAYFEGTCAVTANTEQNITTGFSSIPSLVTTYLECTTADAGYSIGDHVLISSNSVASTGNTGVSVTFDGSVSNDVTVTIGSGGLYLLHKTTNGETALIESSWRLRVKAWK